jgi:hypothetical protein
MMDTMGEQRHPATGVHIAGAVPTVHRVLEMSGCTTILEMYDAVDGAVDDAVASYGT